MIRNILHSLDYDLKNFTSNPVVNKFVFSVMDMTISARAILEHTSILIIYINYSMMKLMVLFILQVLFTIEVIN